MADFRGALESIRDLEGWLTAEQAREIWDRATELEAGARVVEIGSFRGRSTVLLALACPPGVEIVAVDPHGGTDRGPQEWEGKEAEAQQDFHVFQENLRRAEVHDRVRHVRAYSNEALGEVGGVVDLLFIDGAHRWLPCREDIRGWGSRVVPGGVMLIHDSFSSKGVTAALLTELFFSRDWRYEGRRGSLTRYRRSQLRQGERLANAWAQARELPWALRNLILKVMILVGLRRYTRYLGHPSGEWPY